MAAGSTFFTIGHSTRSFDQFLSMLREAGVRGIADVRRFPGSRRFPQFDREQLQPALADAGIEYRHFAELGGRRGTGAVDSPNGWWKIAAFRHYADHALTPRFQRAFDALLQFGSQRPVAVMCAEALWWRCHRRLVADQLLAAGMQVVHLLGPGKQEVAQLSEGARVQPDGRVLYPGVPPQAGLFD